MKNIVAVSPINKKWFSVQSYLLLSSRKLCFVEFLKYVVNMVNSEALSLTVLCILKICLIEFSKTKSLQYIYYISLSLKIPDLFFKEMTRNRIILEHMHAFLSDPSSWINMQIPYYNLRKNNENMLVDVLKN